MEKTEYTKTVCISPYSTVLYCTVRVTRNPNPKTLHHVSKYTYVNRMFRPLFMVLMLRDSYDVAASLDGLMLVLVPWRYVQVGVN